MRKLIGKQRNRSRKRILEDADAEDKDQKAGVEVVEDDTAQNSIID